MASDRERPCEPQDVLNYIAGGKTPEEAAQHFQIPVTLAAAWATAKIKTFPKVFRHCPSAETSGEKNENRSDG